MNSLEWRTRKLENKIFGYAGANSRQALIQHSEPIVKKLNQIAKLYKSFLDNGDDKFMKFLQLYGQNKDLISKLENEPNKNISDAAKAELILAYEEDLRRHMESLKSIADKADSVLDIKNWPDSSVYTERLDKLQKITREQHIQSSHIDSKTEELIEIYNDIITSFRSNIGMWNQKLDVYESEGIDQEENE